MNFEQFSRGSSIVHHTDPRVKIIAAAVLSLIVALCQNFNTAAAGLALATLLTIASRIPLRMVMRRLLIVNAFNLLLWVLLPLTYGQAPWISCAGIELSRPGLLLAALITLKSNTIILYFISLLATSTVARLGHGLQELRLSPRLCLLLLFSYRYIFVLYQEYARLRRAAALRCFKPGTNLHTYKTHSHLLGMLLVKSWNRAARVQYAMELRGFTGVFYSLHELEMNRMDYLLLAGVLPAALGLLLLELLH